MLEAIKSLQSESLVSLSFLRQRIPQEFQNQFCEDTMLCLNCGAHLTQKDEELVCSACGTVWSGEVQVETHTIPFETSSTEEGHSESHFNPVNSLSFGNNLGSASLTGKPLYRVLAKAKAGQTDIGLRALQVKVMVSKFDHPMVTSLLGLGSELLKKHGLTDNTEQNLLLSNTLGSYLRRLGAYFACRNERQFGEPKRCAGALFIDIFRQAFPERFAQLKQETAGNDQLKRLYWEFDLTENEIEYYWRLLTLLTPPPKARKAKKPKGQN